MNTKSKEGIAGACLALVFASGSAIAVAGPSTAATPAQKAGHSKSALKIEPPGVGEIFGAGKALYDAVELCQSNEEHGLPCTQSNEETVNQIHTMLKEFTAKYEHDQEMTRASLDEVINNQKDEAVKAEWRAMRADFETSHVGLKLLDSYGDCARIITANQTGTCEKFDALGNKVEGGQSATFDSLAHIRDAIIANDKGNSDHVGGYSLSPADLAQRVGGKSAKDPYSGDGLLHAILDREQTKEIARQQIKSGTRLTYFPAEYVNSVGEQVNALTQLEAGYFNSRITAAQMEGNKEWGDTLDRLARSGRPDSSPVLSLAEQRKTYEFPNWSPDHRLADNQAYFIGKNLGTVLLTNDGTSGGAALPTAANLPTAKQLQNFGADFGPTYTKYQKLFPNQLPAIDGQRFGNAGSHDMNAVARLWSAPQATWQSRLRESNRFSLECWEGHHDGYNDLQANCAGDHAPMATHLGTTATVNNKASGTTTVPISEAMLKQESVPYTIYPKPTDVQKGWGDGGSSGQTKLTWPTVDGRDVDMLSPRPGAVSADPTWKAYTYYDYNCTSNMGATSCGWSHSSSHGVGTVVDMDASAGNLEMLPIESAGALQ